MTDKPATRGSGVVKLVALLGWLTVLGGLGLAGYGIYVLLMTDAGMAGASPLIGGGAVTAAFGLLALVNATMARAMIDTANNTATLLAGGAVAAAANTDDADAVDIPDIGDAPSSDDAQEDVGDVAETAETATDEAVLDGAPDMPTFDAAPPPAPAIEADTSDPRLWPLAVDEFDLDGHLAMNLEDGSVAVETPQGWRRLQNLEDARTWLGQNS